MTVQELERPDLRKPDHDDELFHYVRKADIVRSALDGMWVTALGGARFQVTRVPKPGSPVCPRCKKIWESLRD